eukprot:TRINITY_DN4175_c1_g1_i3.p1 TRINITY_DN4175_c1_g1~~TRINITY_DN4175_c1_g1_i3.p1  ORF type:complete len:486 (-),score=74.18 TRINITY_DN4175_c1_g1_i3:350-1786(-)
MSVPLLAAASAVLLCLRAATAAAVASASPRLDAAATSDPAAFGEGANALAAARASRREGPAEVAAEGAGAGASAVRAPGVWLLDDCGDVARSRLMRSDGAAAEALVEAEGVLLEELRPPSDRPRGRQRFCWRQMPLPTLPASGADAELVRLGAPDGAAVDMRRMVWVMITGAAENYGRNFVDRVIPSAETWLKHAPNSTVFAVFSDTVQSRSVLQNSSCRSFRQAGSSGASTQLDVFTCSTSGATIYAVLARCKTDEGHDSKTYGDGPCCKYDSIISYLTGEQYVKDAEWVYIADDDMYVETSNLVRMLAVFNASERYVVSFDGSALTRETDFFQWNKAVKECNSHLPQGFFYGVFSAGVLAQLARSIPAGGLSAICRRVGQAYDTTVGLWAWSAGALFIPSRELAWLDVSGLNSKEDRKTFVHGVRKPEIFRQLEAKTAESWETMRRFFPNGSVALLPGRKFAGSADDCSKLLPSQT